ncbi:hypothetical protein Btru_059232 [Bulinus truncatus]|nr:hypothetical protein Btru_059232 [Bulinus truncatus]
MCSGGQRHRNIDFAEPSGKPELFAINPILYNFFLLFNLLVCAGVIGILGVIGNVINVIVFYRQGYSDSVAVTLTALAVSDIGALVTEKGYSITSSLLVYREEHDTSVLDVVSALLFSCQGYFTRVSGLVTTYATFERCMCVILPMKVRLIFTRNVALAVNVIIFVILTLYFFPVYDVVELRYQMYPPTNKTVLTIVYSSDGDYIFLMGYLLNDLSLPYFTFLVNIICTVVIIVTLKTQSKWRTSLSTAKNQMDKDNSASRRERKTMVMLVTVSVIFVVCLAPHSAIQTATGIVGELKLGGAYFEITLVCYTFTFLLETTSCSVSTLVYYSMSSRYRAVVQEMFSFLARKHR